MPVIIGDRHDAFLVACERPVADRDFRPSRFGQDGLHDEGALCRYRLGVGPLQFIQKFDFAV